jgi:hypothetical protein
MNDNELSILRLLMTKLADHNRPNVWVSEWLPIL